MVIFINCTSIAVGKCQKLSFKTPGEPRKPKKLSGHFFLKHPVVRSK
jgi:hypothetical protein